jgi:hypothetical protein
VERWARALSVVPPPVFDIPSGEVVLPMRRSFLGTPVVTIRINGKPHDFWLDTGASMTLLSTDVAIAAGASGVHLKEQSILPAEARRIAPPGFVIGCSIHEISAVSARKSADLLIAGTVRPTASKPAVEYLDEDGLRRIVDAAAGQPVLGIGGLDSSQVPLLAASGAAGMAAVGAFIPSGRDSVAEFVQKRVNGLRLAFDSVSSRT